MLNLFLMGAKLTAMHVVFYAELKTYLQEWVVILDFIFEAFKNLFIIKTV